ncbi:MAG: outer membrane protein assembly factor BamD [Planctomycetes bacterium]|nr:outer membrane protein assembly factor BamD [Planctomycetota bacterium]
MNLDERSLIARFARAGRRLLLAMTVAVWPGTARADDRPTPPTRRAERLTFDEKTHSWIRTGPPVPGTEDGDLDIVRQEMAREDHKAALKAVKSWIKKYGALAPRYPEALHLKATAELASGDYRAAHDDFQALLTTYSGSPYAEDALESDFRVAEQYLAGKRRRAWGGLLRIKDREGGVKILDDIVANYPDTPLAELAQRAKADYYYARGEFELAEDEYATFAKNYPRSRFHPYALLQSAQSALNSFPGVKFDDAGLVEAQERFTQFMRAYPASAQDLDVPVILDTIAARRADKTLEIGKFYQKTQKTNAACYYYRQTVQRWPDTAAAAEARGRLAALGQPMESPAAMSQARLPVEQGG